MIKLFIDTISDVLSNILGDISSSFDKDHSVNAEFGNPNKLISKRNKGWVIDGVRALDMETSRRNLCVVAGSGKGKSQNHVFTSIMNCISSSMVINDNSSELSATLPYLESQGVSTKVMNLVRKENVYINPLDGCNGNVAAMRKIAKTLMGNAAKENDFFSISGEDCITIFIQHVLESEPRINANLGNVYRLILEFQGNPKVIESYMADKASDAVWTKFKALAGNSEKTLKSITSTAISALSWLGDNPVLADLTSVSNISFEDFRKSPTCLFIQSPASDSKFYAPMVSLVFQSFYRYAFSRLPEENDLDIMMILDEFSSLIDGLSDYSQIISNSRKFRIPQAIFLQDESLLSPYKELKDNILANCYVKCYYGGQDKKAFELEKLLGSYSYVDGSSGQTKSRPLMYASEIREMDDEILVITNGQKPIKVRTKPAYKQSKLRKRLAMELDTEVQEEPMDYNIQYIDLSPYKDEIKDKNVEPNNSVTDGQGTLQ
ncbi:type IV secretory system conjugative DNA transfer family protein [uncultured Winogradskyella sp.]|uniref:type IV secretory system conjugative DNA transfer family protein n=1 Tax=uncultured Winogradskyella sp. TaxID=395353 RepID=UPI0026237D81|nr:type IV secretory system conjugative DNA transfer family protein [uncultured Winogradskyella sp.]